MALIPVSKDTLGAKRLKEFTSYSSLAGEALCEIVAGEFALAAPNFPILFIERDGMHAPIVLLGLQAGQNLFVEPNGAWSGAYMPALFRLYPFMLAPVGADGQPVLAINDSMDILSDVDGQLLFGADEAGEMESPVGRALQIVGQIQLQGPATRRLIEQVAKLGLIEPLSLNINQNNKAETVGGLFGVNESKLQALSDEDFLALRHSGALSLVYTHLVSLGQLASLQMRINRRNATQSSSGLVFE